MSCPNCKLFYNKCSAGCCGPVPINREVWAYNIGLVQRPVVKMLELGEDILLETEDMSCAFLSPKFECMIYNSRPEVCKTYGGESHILMTCAYQKPDGSARSRSERRRIEKEQEKQVKKSLG